MKLPRTRTPDELTTIVFGVVLVNDDETTRLLLDEFCGLLGRAIRATVVPHRARSPADLAAEIQGGRVHVAWVSPALLATAQSLTSVVPLVSSLRENMASYHSVLFVPSESSIKTPDQLQGTRVAWAAESSASGYLFPRAALVRRGLDPRTLFASEHFYGSHGAVTQAVFDDRADVGATFAVYENGDSRQGLLRAGFMDVVPGRSGRVIDMAGPIPADVVVAVASMPMIQRSDVTLAMRSIGNDPSARVPLQTIFGVDGFRVFSPDVFAELRGLIVAAREVTTAPR